MLTLKPSWFPTGFFFAATGFYAFCLLSSVVQLHWVLRHGTFLVRRWESQGSMNLCHCANEEHGFLVEVRLTCNCQQANF